VSRIEPRKKHDLLLSAFINLELFEKGYSLVFIGKESIENLNLKNLLNKGNAIRNYFYFESVGKDDLLHFYNGADLFVYPSIAEGFGLPPIEAAVLNTPVLCSSRTAMSDYVFFGDNLFNPSDSSEFESKLLSNLESPKKEEELSYIKRSILDNYSWENSSKKISEIIKSIQ
jgi:glycosyltransferase involved in cell wall biosynthesis